LARRQKRGLTVQQTTFYFPQTVSFEVVDFSDRLSQYFKKIVDAAFYLVIIWGNLRTLGRFAFFAFV